MAKEFKYAMIWGNSVKFTPQKVGKEHMLFDEDVVQIIKKMWLYSGTIWSIQLYHTSSSLVGCRETL